MKRFSRCKEILLDVLFDIAGSFLLSVGILCFSEPAEIAPGGVAGAAILLNHFTGVPLGTLSFLINIPLLVLAFLFLGKRFALRTVRTVVIFTLMMDLVVAPLVPVYSGDRLISVIFAGVFMGLGVGVVFLRGTTTGGVDILSFLIQKKWPHFPIGQVLACMDGAVLVLSVAVFETVEAGLFGLVTIFVQAQLINGMVYGAEKGHMVLVVSVKARKIAMRVNKELGRGATLLKSLGAYTCQEQETMMCAVRKNQFTALKKIVHQEDPRAFVVVTEAGQILGEGFRELQQ